MKKSTAIMLGLLLGAGLGIWAASGTFAERAKVQQKNAELSEKTRTEERKAADLRRAVNTGRRNRASDIVEFSRAAEARSSQDEDSSDR